MARLILTAGESVGLTSGTYNIFGTTTAAETVSIAAGANVTLDASFNKGGDIISLSGNAADYTAVRSGSSLILTSATGSVTIPVGTTAATVQFADATRSLVFNTGTSAVELGTQAVTTTAATVAAGTGGAASAGKDIILTGGQDLVSASSATAVDTIRGTFGVGGTLSTGDEITGNGNTIAQLIVDDAGVNPFFQMSGIDKLVVLNNTGNGTLSFDADQIGSALNSVTLKGNDNLNLDLTGIEVTGALNLTVGARSDGDIDFTGSIDDLSATVSLYGNNDSSDTSLNISKAGITINAGDSDAYVDLGHSGAATAAAITIGDIVIASDSDVDLSITNNASTLAGTASVGNLTVGDLSIDVGASASASVYLYASADATSGLSGTATVGNIVAGDVTVSLATSAYFSLYQSATADSLKGNATVGNLQVGDISIAADAGASSVDFYAYYRIDADARTTGNATVGTIKAGDITVAVNDITDNLTVSLDASADADKGNATIGGISVGDVNMTAGDGQSNNDYLYFNVGLIASADTGTTSIGNTSIGDISMSGGERVDLYASITIDASGDTATIGTLRVGDVTIAGGDGGYAYFGVYDYINADAGTASSVGAVTIGDVDLSAGNSVSGDTARAIAYMTANADGGAIGNATFGDLSFAVGRSGQAGLLLALQGGKSVGSLVIGDVSLALGIDSTVYADYDAMIDVSASSLLTGTVGNITIGNVSYVFDEGANDNAQTGFLYVDAAKTVGNISIGDFSLVAASSADIDADIYVTAEKAIGNVALGDLVIAADKSASVSHDRVFTSNGSSIGNVTQGDITVSAAENGDGQFWLTADADTEIGVVKVGNIAMTGAGDSSYLYGNIQVDNDGADVITSVTIGTVDLNVSGSAASGSLDITVSGEIVGDVTIGNISLSLAATTEANDAYGRVNVDSDATIGGNIKAGNISVAVSGDANADITLDSTGTVTVGNITVSGDAGGNGNLFSDLLRLTGTTKTVGNIDYSGYEGTANIDLTGIKGGAEIKAADGDTSITDNATKNVITLGAGEDDLFIVVGNTGKTEATADQVIGFSKAGDTVNLGATGGTDFHYESLNAGSVSTFLTQAASYMASNDTEVYSGKVGSDSWVAVDKDDNGTFDYVVKFAGVQMDTVGTYMTVGSVI